MDYPKIVGTLIEKNGIYFTMNKEKALFKFDFQTKKIKYLCMLPQKGGHVIVRNSDSLVVMPYSGNVVTQYNEKKKITNYFQIEGVSDAKIISCLNVDDSTVFFNSYLPYLFKYNKKSGQVETIQMEKVDDQNKVYSKGSLIRVGDRLLCGEYEQGRLYSYDLEKKISSKINIDNRIKGVCDLLVRDNIIYILPQSGTLYYKYDMNFHLIKTGEIGMTINYCCRFSKISTKIIVKDYKFGRMFALECQGVDNCKKIDLGYDKDSSMMMVRWMDIIDDKVWANVVDKNGLLIINPEDNVINTEIVLDVENQEQYIMDYMENDGLIEENEYLNTLDNFINCVTVYDD